MSITIKGLSHYYPNGKKALNDINLEIPSGMFGLLGPNGAGKSTLMRILVTLMEPTEGEIDVCGYDIRTQRKEVRRILGYLPQDFRFFAKYKVREFLEYAAALSGMTNSRERGKAVDEMLEQVGLYEARDRYAQNLSGGMKRRLGIAQALIHKPQVLVVDEPTTGLDPEERIRFRNLLSEASTKDTTIILSTHIVGDISSSCTEMAMLNQGQVMFRGSPAGMLKTEGKVWRMQVTNEQYAEINQKYAVISTIPHGLGWDLQVVSKESPGYGAVSYPPNLEHAYVYFTEIRDKE
jgi:ABC-type multidrug transport system ATPase subunit